MSEKSVRVRLVAENGRQVRAEFDGVGDSGERAFGRIERQVDQAGVAMTRVMGMLAAFVSTRQLIQLADTWTDLRSRVDLATGSQEMGAAVMERLGEMADRTYSSLQQTAEGWVQNATVLRELGMTTAQTLDFQEAMNNALVVSGARAERAAQVQNALAQAMALGQLRGQQLNTVIQNGGRVAELLAEELGTTVNGLRQLGAQGAVTGDVIQRALVGNLERLREEADSMPATIGDAFTRIGNAALRLVGQWDSLLRASGMMADSLIFVARNLERVAAYAIPLATFMAGTWVYSFMRARAAAAQLTFSMWALRSAILATGIGALIVASGELIYWFGRLVTGAGGFGAAMRALGDVAGAVWTGIVDSAKTIPERLAITWGRIANGFSSMIASLTEAWSGFLRNIGTSLEDVPGFGLLADSVIARADDAAQRASRRFGEVFAENLRLHGRERTLELMAGDIWGPATEALANLREIMARTAIEGADLNVELARSVREVEDALNRAGGAARATAPDMVEPAEAAAKGWAKALEALRRYRDESMDLAGNMGDAIVSAFRSAEAAVGNFVRTGKLSISDLVRSIIADFAQLAARRFLFGPLSNALMGALDGLMPGAPLNAMGAGPLRSFAGGGHTGFGARTGGLDGMGGRLAIVHPQERFIDETRPGNRRMGSVVVNINGVRDMEGFKRGRSQIMADFQRALGAGGRAL